MSDISPAEPPLPKTKDYSKQERKIVALLESKSRKFWITVLIVGVIMSFLAQYLCG